MHAEPRSQPVFEKQKNEHGVQSTGWFVLPILARLSISSGTFSALLSWDSCTDGASSLSGTSSRVAQDSSVDNVGFLSGASCCVAWDSSLDDVSLLGGTSGRAAIEL